MALWLPKIKRKYEQNKKLYEEDLIAKEDYLIAKEDYETSVENNRMLIERQKQDSMYREIQVENMEESLNNMRRNLKLVRERYDNLNVKAPISGQLGVRIFVCYGLRSVHFVDGLAGWSACLFPSKAMCYVGI